MSANRLRFLIYTLGFGAGGFLRELLPFIASRSYLRCCCLAKKGPSSPACNPFRMLSDEHVDHILHTGNIFMAFSSVARSTACSMSMAERECPATSYTKRRECSRSRGPSQRR